jgi:hypothetical protein
MMTITLLGAYGRTYIDKDKALKDWQDGKDFQIYNGPYCSIRDMDYLTRMNNTVKILLNNGKTVVLHDTIITHSLLDTIL